MKAGCVAFAVATAISLSACNDATRSDAVYTLYRNSILDDGIRVHMATFDSKDGDDYNRENCNLAASLFQSQPAVVTKFWCEKGKYHQ